MDIKKQKKKVSLFHKGKLKIGQKVWIGSYLVMAVIFAAVYFLLKLEVFNIFGSYGILFQKIALAGIFSSIILLAAKVTEFVVGSQSHTVSTKYNLVRVIRLISALLIAMVFISMLFANWYTAAVSLGLISLILGFALQTPIASFISWIYIIIRAPYRVGDRVQINNFTGDVVEINYLDTTLWEFAGDYLSNDLPSGRLIRFPNSLVFSSPVYNYSWEKFPFIWNEIPFHIAYESDLAFVESTIKAVTKKELGDSMTENIENYKKLIAQTPVDELDVKEYPFVCFRINANTWVEALVVYIVDPKKASGVRSRLIKNIINALLKEPKKVMFPNGNSR